MRALWRRNSRHAAMHSAQRHDDTCRRGTRIVSADPESRPHSGFSSSSKSAGLSPPSRTEPTDAAANPFVPRALRSAAGIDARGAPPRGCVGTTPASGRSCPGGTSEDARSPAPIAHSCPATGDRTCIPSATETAAVEELRSTASADDFGSRCGSLPAVTMLRTPRDPARPDWLPERWPASSGDFPSPTRSVSSRSRPTERPPRRHRRSTPSPE